ncbi:DUF1801 domain-containing protein [Mucilaginibacter pallidiroseus]|uniref:DUF1801 domain-containing protein n=1 Tax=Mucilaginibacter pallidiroseus TaxID=2599295 RepID=A0A563UJL5_9SPHI|nr:DUF1801 domain-containing protein [Mucilaginibacter pallidiroseus]TWR31513.1 DUF1801 domain-containing protein [Mucilaginibacter pallidiroseus]
MTKNKTTETENSVEAFLDSIADSTKRGDSLKLVQIMQQETGFEPKLWGPNTIGFGSYHYKYASGHEGDAPLAAFSPRAKEFLIYLSAEFEEKQQLLQQLGKHRAAVACIYIKKLEDIDPDALCKMIVASVKHLKNLYIVT